jgi:integrase
MPSQLPSGKWRGRVRHPRTRKHLNPANILGGPPTYDSPEAARAAEDEVRQLLAARAREGITVREWWEEWTTDPLWKRPAESTNLHNRERTQRFVERYGDLGLRAVSDLTVAEWIKGGQNLSTVQNLKTMWNDAASAPAGRLVKFNPWAGLKLPVKSRRDRTPPGIVGVARLVELADELTPPSFAAYIDVACHEGMRPGELDALRWTKVDFQAETILVDEQWNVKTREFTGPKCHHPRTIALTEPARDRLLSLPHESEFVFTTLRGSHYLPSSRNHHWNRVRAAAGLGKTNLYLATRHYFGWYAFNVLGLSDKDIALHLGHRDGGKLVRTLYGHPDEQIAADKVREAFRTRPAAPIPLRRKDVG